MNTINAHFYWYSNFISLNILGRNNYLVWDAKICITLTQTSVKLKKLLVKFIDDLVIIFIKNNKPLSATWCRNDPYNRSKISKFLLDWGTIEDVLAPKSREIPLFPLVDLCWKKYTYVRMLANRKNFFFSKTHNSVIWKSHMS